MLKDNYLYTPDGPKEPSREVAMIGDPVIMEAKGRWDRCSEWESPSRERFIDDLRFANGDSDNGYQWPNAIRRSREVDSRPCLTMNIIRQHNLQISNQARKNKSSIKIVPQGNGATIESAQVFKSIIRRVEDISSAQDIYTLARNFQIDAGIGYWRVVTRYASEDTFDQDIYFEPVNDPLSVYMDPDMKLKDGSDANYAFIFDNMPLDIFNEQWPQYRDVVGQNALSVGSGDSDWISKDYVRVCEYFRKVGIEDTLISFVYQGVRKQILKSKLPANMRSIMKDPLTKTRPVQRQQIEWYLIAGNEIIDSSIWAGKYIPIVRVVGEETTIDGILDRKGHTRYMKDSQRMFNYNASSQVEFVALQTKTPYVASAQAIEEYESMWNTANTANHSVLIYNGVDDSGQQIPPPERSQPPTSSPAYQQGMDTAFSQMMMTSGQWQNSMGMQGNERTGAAIQGRQAQSETAVFHFQDNYESALIFTGKILIDLIPKIYDTRRVIMIQAENDADMEIVIDPQAQKAFQQEQQETEQAVLSIFNPNVGDYAIAPSAGPSYGSKQQETREAMTLILTQAPQLVPIIGDILLSSMEFDKALEAAQRLKRLVPPAALGNGPTAAEQQLQTQNQSLMQSLTEALQQNAKQDLKLVGKEQMRDIDVYKAQTDRFKALQDALPEDAQEIMEVLHQLVQESLQGGLSPIVEANANNLDVDGPTSGASNTASASAQPVPGPAAPPLEGAKQAPDGEWYVPDPQRPGKYLKAKRRG